jgi:hypothetical protein
VVIPIFRPLHGVLHVLRNVVPQELLQERHGHARDGALGAAGTCYLTTTLGDPVAEPTPSDASMLADVPPESRDASLILAEAEQMSACLEERRIQSERKVRLKCRECMYKGCTACCAPALKIASLRPSSTLSTLCYTLPSAAKGLCSACKSALSVATRAA